jgi:hypothetical protein
VESFWFDRKFTNFLLWKLTNFDEWKCVSLLWGMNFYNHCFSHPKNYIRGWYSWLFPCVKIAFRVLGKLNVHFWQKRHLDTFRFRMFPALHESIVQSCQRALNSEPRTKNHIITPCNSLFSSFLPKKWTFFKQRHKPYRMLRKFSIYKKQDNYNNQKKYHKIS